MRDFALNRVLQVRITERLEGDIQAQAQRLGLRPADVARAAVGVGLAVLAGDAMKQATMLQEVNHVVTAA